MRFASVLTLIAIAGCASSSTPSMTRTTDIGVVGTGGGLRIRSNDGAKVSTLAYPLARVWALLPSVFDSLGIPLTDLDQKTHVIGNSGLKAHKTLGKTALSKLIDCGASQGFPSADTYDIHLSIITQLTANEDGTSIGTMVEASGRPMAFPGGYSRCTTTEALENQIVDLVKAKLAR
jgi:hypothetical protein